MSHPVSEINLVSWDIEARLRELHSFSHMSEILLEQVGREYFEEASFDVCEVFAIQKRLYEGLHGEHLHLIELLEEKALVNSPVDDV